MVCLALGMSGITSSKCRCVYVCAATHCTATQCNTLQHTPVSCLLLPQRNADVYMCVCAATHCNTLQHTPVACLLLPQSNAGCFMCVAVSLQCLQKRALHDMKRGYGVAKMSRLLKFIGLFCKRNTCRIMYRYTHVCDICINICIYLIYLCIYILCIYDIHLCIIRHVFMHI